MEGCKASEILAKQQDGQRWNGV